MSPNTCIECFLGCLSKNFNIRSQFLGIILFIDNNKINSQNNINNLFIVACTGIGENECLLCKSPDYFLDGTSCLKLCPDTKYGNTSN